MKFTCFTHTYSGSVFAYFFLGCFSNVCTLSKHGIFKQHCFTLVKTFFFGGTAFADNLWENAFLGMESYPVFCLTFMFFDDFLGIVFSASFLKQFLSLFEGRFGTPNRRKCPQAVIQNRPSKNVCPNFGFGSFVDDFRPPWILESERLAWARCSFSHFYPFAVFWRRGPKSRQNESKSDPQIGSKINQNTMFDSSLFNFFFGIDCCSKMTPKWDP